jgi:hypothetical protein
MISAATINATTSLQEGGVDVDTIFMKKPWVQCVVAIGGTVFPNSSVGQQTPTISRTSGQAAGAWDISFQLIQTAWLIRIMFKLEQTRE